MYKASHATKHWIQSYTQCLLNSEIRQIAWWFFLTRTPFLSLFSMQQIWLLLQQDQPIIHIPLKTLQSQSKSEIFTMALGKDWCWSWNSSTLATWFEEMTHWKRPWCWERWKAEEKGTTENERVGWHHRFNGHEFEQTPGVGDGQGSLVRCSPWGHKESDTTEWLQNKKLKLSAWKYARWPGY